MEELEKRIAALELEVQEMSQSELVLRVPTRFLQGLIDKAVDSLTDKEVGKD